MKKSQEPKFAVEVTTVGVTPNGEVSFDTTILRSDNVTRDEVREGIAAMEGISPDEVILGPDVDHGTGRRGSAAGTAGRVSVGFVGKWNTTKYVASADMPKDDASWVAEAEKGGMN